MSKARIIALYLPQYHPFKENDEWWGNGFTEWTNVAKARPLFKGHYQPKIPTDLGFYDLRISETRELQAKLAKEAGIEGFCYWHYWFEGHELMERPFWEVVNSGKPDFPFCIGWANESWHSKIWNKDGSLASETKLLIEQTYSEKDDVNHFNALLNVFKDHRYILVDGEPLVFIHRATLLPEHTLRNWEEMARENGFPGIHFVGRIAFNEDANKTKKILLDRGFKAVTVSRLGRYPSDKSIIRRMTRMLWKTVRFNGCRHVMTYKREMKTMIDPMFDTSPDVYPAIYPNWDHSPRSGRGGLILTGSTPQLFEEHVKQVLKELDSKPESRKIAFVKSWNEWGEGNYLEPDIRFGRAYLDVLKKQLVDHSRIE